MDYYLHGVCNNVKLNVQRHITVHVRASFVKYFAKEIHP